MGGVTAYSTLGWFSDTVFSTIIRRDESATAALIFHELAHQILYVSDDTTFNESFATTVEQEGLRRWMAANGNPLGYQAYVLQGRRRQELLALVTKYHEKLAELYRRRTWYRKRCGAAKRRCSRICGMNTRTQGRLARLCRLRLCSTCC